MRLRLRLRLRQKRRSRRPSIRRSRGRSRRQRGGAMDTVDPTFHFLLCTAGRPQLRRMLESIKGEVAPADAITIVFDGKDAQAKAGWSDSWKEGCPCPIAVHVEPTSHGHWGHPLRSKWQTKLAPITTFILHADDDDVYHAGFLQKLRHSCTDPATFYIAKMRDKTKGRLIPSRPSIEFMNIGTPCGIVPWALAGSGDWPTRLGGDMEYFKAVAAAATAKQKPPVFLPHLIYEVNPQ